MTGRMYRRSWPGAACRRVFGFNLTFFPQFMMGSRGMPRRYWDYEPEFTLYHRLSTIGAVVLGVGSLFMIVCYLLWSFKRGRKAPAEPVGRHHARVAGADAAAHLQLRRRRPARRSTTYDDGGRVKWDEPVQARVAGHDDHADSPERSRPRRPRSP
jgi:heme/copper-type cytochrome/quinol oxidase subunit 1